MNENENYTPPAGYGPNQRPPLRRDRRGGMLTGVCAGLGRYLDLDPVIFRIVFVVLSLGGLGILIYVVAWLLVPADGENVPEARRILDNRSLVALIAVVVVLVLAAGSVIRVFAHGFGGTVPLLVCAVAVLAYLVWRGENHGSPGSYGPGYRRWDGGNGPQPPQPWWQRPVPTYPATPGTGFEAPAPGAPGTDPAAGTENAGAGNGGTSGTGASGSEPARDDDVSDAKQD